MHKLLEIEQSVNATHPGLGKAVAFCAAACEARRCVLLVAPAGCGKSTICLTLRRMFEQTKSFDVLTKAALGRYQDELTDWTGVALIEDLGKESYLNRLATIIVFSDLVYGHEIHRDTHRSEAHITGFSGAAVLMSQPIILSRLVRAPEWDSNIADKTIRYYHLRRPVDVETALPQVPSYNLVDLGDIEPYHGDRASLMPLFAQGYVQWSTGRVIEHVDMLLRAAAYMDGRSIVIQDDIDILLYLLAPMMMERFAVRKNSFEGGRFLESELLCLLTEFATYRTIEVSTLQLNYKISEVSAYRILQQLSKYWRVVEGDDTRFIPSEEAQKILKETGNL